MMVRLKWYLDPHSPLIQLKTKLSKLQPLRQYFWIRACDQIAQKRKLIGAVDNCIQQQFSHDSADWMQGHFRLHLTPIEKEDL